MKKSILYILFALFSLSAAVSLTACKDDGVEISGANKSKTPKNVKLLEYGATSLTICWDFIRGATSYTVQLVDGEMNPVSEALCKTTDAIDYHEFTDLAADRIYYGRVRANYPYSSTSDWVYVTANEQPAMLMASVGILELDPKLTLNAATGSTLTYEWSYTEDAATDATRLYNIELFRDEACSELHVSWLADGKLASDKGIFTALAGYPVVRFTFSGLDPETTYYARVTNASFGNIMTPVVAGTTAKAGPKASQNNPAQAGDIVLAQDFAAFIHGGDIVRSAAGYNAVSGTEFRKTWEPATGENPQADGDRPVCNWTTEFNVFTGGTSAEYIESVGMKGWGLSGNTSTRPGYIKCGGGGGGIGILYTPELAALPKNTTVTVSFSASAYAEGQTAGSGNGVRTVLLRQPGEQGVEGRVCQEIVDHDQRSAMSRSGDPPGQHGLADNDVGIGGNAVRGTVADHHADARIGEPFSKPRGTQRTRPHARIAGENHLADMCREVLRGLYGGRPALRGGDCACRHILRGGGTPDEGRRHEQRHRRGDQHSGQHDEGLAFGSHGQHRNDAAGRSRRHQSGPGKRKEQQPGGTARNRGEDQRRARQDIGKIDFVDTAAELDDYGAGRRLAHIAAAEKPAGQQYAQPGAWIRFQQEHDRLPGFAGLLDADRREDAVVQGIIEEQHLGRLDQKRHERQQSVADHDLHAVADQQRQPRHRTADDPIAQYGQQHTEDAYREIAHEHLEARLYASLRKFVEPPDRIPAQRAHDHGSDEHRDIAADDDAHGGNGPDYPAAFAGDVAPGRIGDQQRQQVGQHRVDQACHLGVGPPSRGDEERRDESPRDERADVGHDHAAQGPAEFLYLLSHSFLSCI